MISGRKHIAQKFQGHGDRKQHRPEHYFDDLIQNPAVKVRLTETQVLIAAPSYAEYLFARKAIVGHTSLEVAEDK